jgi:acyl carrier protein
MDDAPKNAAEVLLQIDSQRSARPSLDTPFVAPRDSVESRVASIWSEVLGFRELGIDDNFFALGGDSLQMTQIASRIYKQYGIEIPFSAFFDQPTITCLAEVIRRSTANDASMAK